MSTPIEGALFREAERCLREAAAAAAAQAVSTITRTSKLKAGAEAAF